MTVFIMIISFAVISLFVWCLELGREIDRLKEIDKSIFSTFDEINKQQESQNRSLEMLAGIKK